MSLSYQELSSRAAQADDFIVAGGETTKASPGIMDEQTAQRAAELLSKRSRFLHSEVDRIEDYQWVSETLYVKGFKLEEEYEKMRFYSTADRKYEDTSFGGNYVCNPRPGYTPFADPPKPGLIRDRNKFEVVAQMTNQGMGAYYSEAIDDSYQVIHMRFGKPEFNSLTGFFTSFYDAGAAYLANSGRVSGFFYKAGQVVGGAAAFVFLGGVTLFTIMAVAYIGSGLKGILSTNPSKFYYSRPCMPLYWSAVTSMVQQIATHRGIFPMVSGDQKIGEQQEFDSEMQQFLSTAMPGVFEESGYINIKNLVTRVARINNKILKEQKEAIKNASDFASFQSAMKGSYSNINPKSEGLSLKGLFEKWIGTEIGGDPKDSDQRQLETVLGGSLEQRYAGEALEEKKNTSYDPSLAETLLGKLSAAKEFWDAEMTDGSAFASFRVDHTGPVTESFSNSTKPSDLAQKFNSISAQGRAAYYTFAGGNVAGSMIKEVTDSVQQMIAGAANFLKIDGLLSLSGSAFVDIPDHWENSVAQLPSKSYTMRLVSPYGHPVSQLINIYIPLAMILAAALPHAAGRQAYTQPFLCELYDQGRSITRCGMVESLQITRGVSNLGFTKHKDMLAVDVQFSVKDLSSVMYVPIEPPSVDPFKTIHVHDSTFSDYMAALGAATLGENIYRGQKLKIRVKNWMRGGIQEVTSMEHWMGVIRDLPVINIADIFYEDTGRGN